ncbi:hypothetical protein PFISCL1PPCAC_18251 [Pristionchus fissidentatus]|uniref:DOMON domain-containing protein n=1 Tax=Pristionchus fissidentatus TaxID=1538716 RepID=A0AAV5W8A8_9BILA|nr:hypothetical protein PFISCL1PPCAC_18251 [Pristionchus fissidentatus]
MRWLALSLALFGAVAARPSATREALCSYGTSNYSLSWEFDELSNDVVFRLTATSVARNFWTGVYFGEEEPFDAIGLFVRNGQIGLVDAHLPAGEEATVVADDLTNVQSLQFDMVEGRLTAEFARPLSSHDPQDSDLSKCSTFFFPEAEEITRSGQITLPNMSMSRRVCDIARRCPARRANRHREEPFKREENTAEAAVAAVAAVPEPVAAIEAEAPEELAVEKKETPAAPTCNYDFEGSSVNWRLEGDNVVFSVSQPNKKGKWYSAFGVGENMQNLRALVAFTENGKLQKTVAIKSEQYGPPETLELEPTILATGAEKGYSNYEIAASKTDVFGNDFNGCVTLQVGLYIGKYGKNYSIQKHQKIPTAINVCAIDKCQKVQKAEKIEEIEASGLEAVEGSGAEAAPVLAAAAPTEAPKEESLLFSPFPASTAAPAAEAPVIATEAPKAEEPKAEEPKAEEPKPEEPKPEEPKPEEPKPEESKPEVQADEPKVELATEAAAPAVAAAEPTTTAVAAPAVAAEEPRKEEEIIEGSGIEPAAAAPKEEEKKIDDALLIISTPRPSMAEMEAEIAKVAATTVVTPLVNGECSADHKDLKVCTSYFADYLEKVEEWAKNHEQTLRSQMWKACTLLSEVKHVPNMCCTIFRDTCAEHVKV